MNYALEVCDVAKRFDRIQALANVCFGIGFAEKLALLGPNGAGKTTTVRCISGRVTPDRGRIKFMGQRLPARGKREALGFVPQDLAVYSDLTARENLEAFGRFHGLRGATLRSAVDWTLDWTGLADRAGHQLKTFSGGMKRRINIACGVMHRPQVVLLDEPTVGVDPQSRERIFQMLEQLRQDGTSILLTTHNLEDAETQCDRIVIIDHGEVVADGTLNELVAETIGTNRRVTVRLTEPLESSSGFAMDDSRMSVRAEIQDVARDLPALLGQINHRGGTIDDVEVRSPSLHAVFLHLTGRELRE